MTTLLLYCDVRRIGPRYESGRTHFSLTLTLAFDRALTPDPLLACPWLWTWTKLRVWNVDSGQELQGARLLPAPALDDVALRRSLMQRFDGLYALDPESFVDPPLDQPTSIKKSWKAFLGAQSKLPAALPHALKLSGLFSLDDASLPARLVAAPNFAVPAFGSPSGAPQKPKPDGPWEWAYEAGVGDVNMVARIGDCGTADPGAHGPFDLDTLWVRSPAAATSGRDWVLELEHRLPEWLDAPTAFLAYLDYLVRSPGEHKLPKNFYRAFVTLLQDTSGYGVYSSPAGTCPASAVLKDAALAAVVSTANKLRFEPWRDSLRDFYDASGTDPRAFALPEVSDGYESVDSLRSARALLGRLQALLTDDVSLRARVAQLWELKPRSDARKNLDQLSLRRILLAGNAGVAWAAIEQRLNHGTTPTPKELAQLIVDEVLLYLDARLVIGDVPRGKYATYRPALGDIEASDEAYVRLRAWLAEYVRRQVAGPLHLTMTGLKLAGTEDDSSPSLSADGVGIQIDGFEHLAAVRPALSGVGLMLQSDADARWCCLHLANVHAEDRPGIYSAQSLAPASVVPGALALRNGVPQLFMEYQAHPLAARSPASGLIQRRELQPPQQTTSSSALLRYENPYDGERLRLPALGFGWSYTAAVFAVGNGGVLPKDIAEPAEPWRLAVKASPPKDAPWPPLLLRRRVPVGVVRVSSKEPVPPVPDDVFPIARALHLLEEPQAHRTRPLVLLVPDGGSYKPEHVLTSVVLELESPTVDLPTWDRWVLRRQSSPNTDDKALKLRRKKVWAGVGRANDVGEGESNSKAHEARLDDPAVSGIRVTLRRVFSFGATPQVASYDFPSTTRPLPYGQTYNGSLDYEQRAALKLSVKIGDEQHEGLAIDGTGFAAVVVKGALYELGVEPIIDDSGSWFASTPVPTPFTIFVEVPRELEKTAATSLRRRLSVGTTKAASAPTDSFQVALKLAPSLPADALLHRADVIIQRWRWDGKPVAHYRPIGADLPIRVPGFPIDRLLDEDDAAATLCDATLFASRHKNDAQTTQTSCDVLTSAPAEEMVLYEHPLGINYGAMYFRVAARFYSRYTGLLANKEGIDTREEQLPNVGVPPKQEDRWVRSLVKATAAEQVPSPAVRMVIPLTSSDDAGDGAAAGLLVVLNEEWFTEHGYRGGIAEEMEAEAVQVSLPDRSGVRPQLGKDPIVDTEPASAQRWRITPKPLIGPTGYTFDTSSEAPLFVHTSFIVQPPTVLDSASGRELDLARFFIQLRFRRVLHPRLAGKRTAAQRVSPWTGAFWSQFLAASNRQRVLDGAKQDFLVATSDLALRMFDDHRVEIFRRSTGLAVAPIPTSSSAEKRATGPFRLYALVTRRVVDAFGRREQEVFESIAKLEGALVPVKPTKPDAAPGSAVTSAGLCVRFVEVLLRPDVQSEPFGSWKSLAEKLFPSAGTEASAQIVRVSPPIVAPT